MNLEILILEVWEVGKSDTEWQGSCDITYMWNLKRMELFSNELIFKAEVESQM